MLRDKSLPMVYAGMVFLLSACATVANGGEGDAQQVSGAAKFADDPRLGERVDRMCFTSTIDGFSQPDEDTVVLRASASRHYLVETASCFNLDRALSIGIDSRTSCAGRGDRLIVSDSIFPGRTSTATSVDSCLITAIYEWDDDADEEAEEAAEE
ncbi:DUF6491 family protein [Ponticaulis sp.]|uniref:DUF6491 family protein n=1 Tax=Ponticaulis sp. TaxID=2020902 RepID=UPI000C53B353|nr:DUF6491 family protein [Ponticaulis sp.]MAF58513.1 hypothetical protein [Ponticaulis sp.]MBN04244.1 hypothetical protein [Ponticaulis sp.]